MAERRVLSSLDLLPEECQDDVAWALCQLNQRSRTQVDILADLNRRLAEKGQGPLSRSAFSRRNVRLKRRRDRLEERSAIYAGIVEQLQPDKVGDADLVLGELIKTLIDDLLDEAKTTKQAQELAAAYKNVVTGQQVSADRRATENRRAAEKLDRTVEKVAEEVCRTGRPVDAGQVLELIRKAYREGA